MSERWIDKNTALIDSSMPWPRLDKFDERIAALEVSVTMANNRIDELVDRLADTNTKVGDALAKQRAVNEALLAWAIEICARPAVITTLRDTLES